MEDESTEPGGNEDLSVNQAAAAFLKSTAPEADKATPDPDDNEEVEDTAEDEDATDEDADEPEDDSDDEGQADDEDDDDPEAEDVFIAPTGKVKLPDGTVATVADLIKGNLRDRDYRQKTMALADETRQFKEQSSRFEADTQKTQELLQYAQQLIQTVSPQPPDTSLLDSNSDNYDPFGYTEQRAIYDNFVAHNQYMQQNRYAHEQQAADQQRKLGAERQDQEWSTLLEKLPDLSQETKLQSFAAGIKQAGEAYGFTPQELAESVPLDHRMALALSDAAKWRKLQSSKPKAQARMEGKPPVQRSGKRLSSGAQRAHQASEARTRLKETGTVEDATAAYLASMRRK